MKGEVVGEVIARRSRARPGCVKSGEGGEPEPDGVEAAVPAGHPVEAEVGPTEAHRPRPPERQRHAPGERDGGDRQQRTGGAALGGGGAAHERGGGEAARRHHGRCDPLEGPADRDARRREGDPGDHPQRDQGTAPAEASGEAGDEREREPRVVEVHRRQLHDGVAEPERIASGPADREPSRSDREEGERRVDADRRIEATPGEEPADPDAAGDEPHGEPRERHRCGDGALLGHEGGRSDERRRPCGEAEPSERRRGRTGVATACETQPEGHEDEGRQQQEAGGPRRLHDQRPPQPQHPAGGRLCSGGQRSAHVVDDNLVNVYSQDE